MFAITLYYHPTKKKLHKITHDINKWNSAQKVIDAFMMDAPEGFDLPAEKKRLQDCIGVQSVEAFIVSGEV